MAKNGAHLERDFVALTRNGMGTAIPANLALARRDFECSRARSVEETLLFRTRASTSSVIGGSIGVIRELRSNEGFGDFSLIPTGFRRNPLLYRRLAMILASISGGQSLGKPLPNLSRQGPSLCEGPFSVSCRKSKPFKPSDTVGFDESLRICTFSFEPFQLAS